MYNDDDYCILSPEVNAILRAANKPIDTLVTCRNCGTVTEIGHRCDGCGRYV